MQNTVESMVVRMWLAKAQERSSTETNLQRRRETLTPAMESCVPLQRSGPDGSRYQH